MTTKTGTIENVAGWLLAQRIPFKYEIDSLQVTDPSFDEFTFASYHSETKKLVLMDGKYNEVPMFEHLGTY